MISPRVAIGDEVAVFGGRPIDLDPERDERVLDPERARRQVLTGASEHVAEDAASSGAIV